MRLDIIFVYSILLYLMYSICYRVVTISKFNPTICIITNNQQMKKSGDTHDIRQRVCEYCIKPSIQHVAIYSNLDQIIMIYAFKKIKKYIILQHSDILISKSTVQNLVFSIYSNLQRFYVAPSIWELSVSCIKKQRHLCGINKVLYTKRSQKLPKPLQRYKIYTIPYYEFNLNSWGMYYS